MKEYEPELGQAVFDNPRSKYDCPDFVIQGLGFLRTMIRFLTDDSNPTLSNGSPFITPTFIMRAYYWGDDPQIQALPNFKYGDLEVRWYMNKYVTRKAIINRLITASDFVDVMQHCLSAIQHSRHQP